MRTWVLAATLAISTVMTAPPVQASGLTDSLTQLLGGRSDFCSKLLSNRISKLDPTQTENCRQVSDTDAECRARCNKIADEDKAAAQAAKQSARETAFSVGKQSEHGSSKHTKESFCGSNFTRPGKLTESECSDAFSSGILAEQEEVAKKAEAELQSRNSLIEQSNKERDRIKSLQTFYLSKEFIRLRTSIAALSKQARIELAEKEQQREKSIARQSGFIDKSRMHALGSQIVDARQSQNSALQEYKKAGGESKTLDEIRSKLVVCGFTLEILQAMFIYAETGHLNTPTESEKEIWRKIGSCI